MIKRDFTKKIAEFQNKENQDKINFLSDFWGIDIKNEPFKLIGNYKKSDKPDKNGKKYGFFVNVRSLNGDILYYPFGLGPVHIWVEHRENLSTQEFWLFYVKLGEWKDIKNPFQLSLANKTFGNTRNRFLDRIEKEKQIRKIFDETGSTRRDAKNSSNALKRIAGDLYTETERFIFELLQNADDIPNEQGEVDVKFNLLLENLLFLHNGKPFDYNDVESITSIGDSTKRKDTEKTGYKGIGFKSVFTDAESVLINSGNYSFSFDKYSPLYKGQNIEEIPWEIKPIWTEVYRYPKEVKGNEEFFKYPVAIDLEVGEEKMNSYRRQISELFSEPRFILFLRHIKSIEVQGLSSNKKIQKREKNNRFELLSNEEPIDEWIIDDFDFSVSKEIRDDMSNDKAVPEKLKEIQKSRLSFACQIKNDEIVSITPDKSFLFTYLPTNVNDYNFPFLVNADFLTTANRQSIHIKNDWNLYLFEQIGYLCFKWISKLSQINGIRNSITSLIPKYYDKTKEPAYSHFNKGFDTAISEIAFLPTCKSELTKVSDAIVDLTGFSDKIGEKLFAGTCFDNKNLIINELQNKKKLTELNGITVFGKEELKKVIANSDFGMLTNIRDLLEIFNRNKESDIDSCDIRDVVENANLDSINNWIADCDNETYEVFLKELEKSGLRQKTKERICQIKLFKFSDEKWYSFNDIIKETSDSVVICNHKTADIKDILAKLGFVTSNLKIPEYKNIYASIQMPAVEKSLYDYIAEKCKTNTLTPAEKKKLFLNFTKFTDVGDATLKELCLFADKNGQIKPLKILIYSILQTPEWLQDWVLKPDEYFDELKSYLIAESGIYPTVILPNWDTLIAKVKDIKNLYEKTVYYFGLEEYNTPLRNSKFVYTENGFMQEDQVFFNSKMIELGDSYANLQNALLSLCDLPTPDKSITSFLINAPFKLNDSKFCRGALKTVTLDVNDIKAVLSFCKLNNEQFFKNYIIKKTTNGYILDSKTDITFQITSPDNEARKFIEENCADRLFVLPHDFLEYKEGDGIIKADDLHGKILEIVDVNMHKEILVDIVKYRAKLQFLQKLSEIRLNADSKYSKDDYEYKVLELACGEIQGIEMQKFRQKIVIDSNGSDLSLSEIPPCADKVVLDSKELSLSLILPNQYQNSNILSDLLNQFVVLGLQKEKLYELFGIQSEADSKQIFELLSNEYSILENAQQLAFLLLYDREISNVKFYNFKVETLDGKSSELKYSYYTQVFSFIGDDYLLKPQYADIENILPLPKTIRNTGNKILAKPYFEDDKFVCPGIKSNLSEEEKLSLLDFLFDQWAKHNKKDKIKAIDWSKIGNNDTEKFLDINPNTCVYPSKYACESEQLPKYLIEWIDEDEQKIKFLADWKIWTDGSTIVDLRKFWNNESYFESTLLERETRFDNSKTNLTNSFEWLRQKNIQLNTKEQYDIFKQAIEIKNKNCSYSYCYNIEELYDYNSIKQQVEEWDDSNYKDWKNQLNNKFTVYLHKGDLPKIVRIKGEFDNFIFYRFNEGNFTIDEENNIYVNDTVDVFDSLLALSSENKKKLSSDDLLLFIAAKSNTQLELKDRIRELENMLAKTNIANIGFDSSSGISKEQQIEENFEAKQIVKERLEPEGYVFPDNYLEQDSTINGVTKDSEEYPLVVKSYKYDKVPFKIAVNEWIHLLNPNAMFWVHFGQGRLGCLKLFDLLRNQSQMSISFSTENLNFEERIGQFAEILHFFKDVHFDFNNFKVLNTADNLKDYRFDTRQTEEDITDNDSDSML